MVRFGQIVLMCVAAAVVYGILHDQVTVRISPEYFTVAHPNILGVQDAHTRDQGVLTALALVWGVIATWWVGLGLGLPLALAARVGRWPKLGAENLVRPLVIVLVASGVCAAAAGVAAALLLEARTLSEFNPWLAERVPPDSHKALVVAGAAHMGSYGAGFVGGFVLIISTAVRRWGMARRGEAVVKE